MLMLMFSADGIYSTFTSVCIVAASVKCGVIIVANENNEPQNNN